MMLLRCMRHTHNTLRHRHIITQSPTSLSAYLPHTPCTIHTTHSRHVYYAVPQSDPRSKKAVFTEPTTAFRTIVLNQPSTHHTLTYPILTRLHNLLTAIDAHDSLTGVMVASQDEGARVFTAGTDYRALYDDGRLAQQQIRSNVQPTNTLQYDYINQAYKLAYLTATMRKPYIAALDGLTLGAGFALAANGRFRIATQNTAIAFNEAQYGLIPHYGTTYMLPRLCGKLGYWLALTGMQVNGADVFHCGFATHFSDPGAIQPIARSFEGLTTPHRLMGQHAVDGAMMPYQDIPAFTWLKHLDWIDEVFIQNHTIEDVIKALERTVASGNVNEVNSPAYIAKRGLDNMYRSSPLALKLTLTVLQLSETLSYEQCMQLEYRVISALLQHNDFYAAVKCKVVDGSDAAPAWTLKEMNDVHDSVIDRYIAPYDDPADELQLNKPDHTLRWVHGQPLPLESDGRLYDKFVGGQADVQSLVTVDNVGETDQDRKLKFDALNPLVRSDEITEQDINELAEAIGIDPKLLDQAPAVQKAK